MNENFKKWRRGFAQAHLLYLVAVILLIAGIVFVWLYFKHGPVSRLQAENTSSQEEIVKLKSHNEKLHEENLQILHYKDLLDPIRRKAKQLYPELGPDTAIAMLAEDVKTLQEPGAHERGPAPRDMYKPLSGDIRQAIVSELQGIIAHYRGAGPKVKIIFDAGNLIRLQVAESLHGILREAGYRVGDELTISFIKHGPGVSISFNPEDSETAYKIGTAVYKFINNQYVGVEEAERLRATYEIIIAGEPSISENGTVTFR